MCQSNSVLLVILNLIGSFYFDWHILTRSYKSESRIYEVLVLRSVESTASSLIVLSSQVSDWVCLPL